MAGPTPALQPCFGAVPNRAGRCIPYVVFAPCLLRYPARVLAPPLNYQSKTHSFERLRPGLSMIEGLVSLTIVAFGVLGLLGLQARALSFQRD